MKYGSSLKVGIAFGLMLGLLTLGIRLSSGDTLVQLLPQALATAVFGGLAMGLYMRSHNSRMSAEVAAFGKSLRENEKVLLEDAAGHYRSGECVAGRLWLTETGLYFCSHAGTLNSHTMFVPTGEFKSVVPTKIAGITNGFLLETENASECFAISRAAKWIEAIKKVTD
ncbi:MAG: hypothetical protein MR903_03330 [Clostridiales bacterium]|nr:hypothetical protein [Clostridiales bacterium]